MLRPLFLLFTLCLPAPAEFSRAPYVQMTTETSAALVWRTVGHHGTHVRYGTDPNDLNQIVSDGDLLVRTSHPQSPQPLHPSTPPDVHQFEARLKGLQPDTTYYYGIYDENQQRLTEGDPSYHFQTHPLRGEESPVYFWVVGDSGTGGRQQAMVHDAMLRRTAALGRELDLYLHVGDMAYGSGTDTEFSERFFKMYAPTLRHTVCWAAMGNHEGRTSNGRNGTGPFYDAYICPTEGEAGGLPSGNESYYSFDYGRIHFICLNSHDLDRRPTGAMARWLKADLEATDADFLVAFWHHPPYTMGSHNSDVEKQLIEMREHLMPILESGGVDVFFNGHSHIYERSMLIDGAYQTPTVADGVILDDGDGDPAGDGPYQKSAGLTPHNGTVAVVAGHGGTGVSRKGTSPIMRRIIVENGSVLVHIEGRTLTAEMINLHGEIRDTFAIVKKGKVEPSVVFDPWQPEPYSPQVKTPPARERLPDPLPLRELIPRSSFWHFLAGKDLHPQGPANAWTRPEAPLDPRWKQGMAGFGYGDGDDATSLEEMKGNYRVAYFKTRFHAPKDVHPSKLQLRISYDDAFIAWLNGEEILRVGVDHEQGPTAEDFTPHEAGGRFDVFPLKGIEKILRPGQWNTLAIEGHNVTLDSSDFTIHPSLVEILQ